MRALAIARQKIEHIGAECQKAERAALAISARRRMCELERYMPAGDADIGQMAAKRGMMMKRILLGIACALSLAAFTTSVARADDKPADAAPAPAKKTHHKKKKSAEGDKGAATTTPAK